MAKRIEIMAIKARRRTDLENRSINYALALEKLNSNPKLRQLPEEEKRIIIDNILLAPFLDLTDDFAFKKVLGHNGNILKVLLSDILDEDIEEVDYESNEIPVLAPDDKHARFDVSCTLKDGRRIVVEMQNLNEEDLHQRLFYYGAALAATQVKKGSLYKGLQATYVIAFLNFERSHLPLRDDKVVFCYSLLEGETGEKYESDPLSLYLCELPRLNKGVQELSSPVEKWLYILRNCSKFASNEQEAFGERYAEFFLQARTRHLTDDELMEYFDSKISAYRAEMLQQAGYKDGFRAGEAKGEVKGLKKGREEGKAQVKAEIAKAMLADGVDLDLIAKYSGLTLEQIEALKTPDA